MTWMVTGGAGYIGSHVVRALQDAGMLPVVSTTCRPASSSSCPTTCRSSRRPCSTGPRWTEALREHDVTGVIHIAGFKYAGVSVARPLHTYEQNVTGTVNLLEAMGSAGVSRIVFSSSAATFGTPDVDLVTEETPIGAGVAVRRDQADRRVAAARRGPGPRPDAHLAALLQRGGLRVGGPLRHQPAQPVPAGLRHALPRRDPADQRRRLPHRRRHLRARLHPRRGPRAPSGA